MRVSSVCMSVWYWLVEHLVCQLSFLGCRHELVSRAGGDGVRAAVSVSARSKCTACVYGVHGTPAPCGNGA